MNGFRLPTLDFTVYSSGFYIEAKALRKTTQSAHATQYIGIYTHYTAYVLFPLYTPNYLYISH